MAQFEVSGADKQGRNVKIVVESDSVRGARAKARAQGLTPVSVVTADAATTNKASEGFGQVIRNPLGGVKSTEVMNMTRQLATLVKAHVPIVESLSALIEQIEYPKLKKVLSAVRQSVNEGRSLADGFAQFPKIFEPVYINMVRAGESSGKLDVVLLRLADFAENRQRLKQKIGSALTYPIVMVVVGILVLGVIFVKVVPQITGIFGDMKQELPTPTKILIAISTILTQYYAVLLVGTLVVAVLFERYLRTESGRRRKDEISLRLPIVAGLTQKLAVARFARTLGTLLASGVPMITALQITRNVVSNSVFEDVVETAETQVSEGRSLAYTLKQSRRFPPIVVHMVGVGEKTGELESMLENVASNYEQQVDTTLGGLTALLEPLMMVVMAVLVGFIVMAVLMPIFEMNNFR